MNQSIPVYTLEYQNDDDDNYSLQYSETLRRLGNAYNLSEETLDRAVDLADQLGYEYKQHHDPRHLAAASLQLACREHREPATVKGFADLLTRPDRPLDRFRDTGDHQQPIFSAMRTLRREAGVNPCPVPAEKYVPLICERVGVEDRVREKALEVMNRIQDNVLASGKSQIGMAAVATYLAEKYSKNGDVSVKRFAEAACRDVTTVRGNASKVEDELGSRELQG